MRKLQYLIERYGPYVVTIIVTGIVIKNKINYIDSDNIDNAMEGILTVASLIVGFIGAILPVILGMKNDSKIVVYVFQKDKDKLFLKYIRTAIMTGMMIIVVSILIYFRNSYVNTIVYKNIFYIWTFCLILFLGCTYRAISLMLRLIFTSDDDLPKFTRKKETEEMLKFKNEI